MSSADWWARRLGAPAPERPAQAPAATQSGYQGPQAPSATPRHAQSAQARHNQGSCPECGSENYFAMQSDDLRLRQMSAAPRCFDCGYPVRQTTSGMGSARGTGESSPSRQMNARGTSQYNPQTIVGRVG